MSNEDGTPRPGEERVTQDLDEWIEANFDLDEIGAAEPEEVFLLPYSGWKRGESFDQYVARSSAAAVAARPPSAAGRAPADISHLPAAEREGTPPDLRADAGPGLQGSNRELAGAAGWAGVGSSRLGSGEIPPSASFEPDGRSDQPRTRPRSPRSRVILAAVVALILVGAGWAALQQFGAQAPIAGSPTPTSVPSPSCQAPSPPPITESRTPRRGVWQASVYNTWSIEKCRDVGVVPRVSPLRSELIFPGFFSGNHVSVVCYYPDGDVVTDKDTGKSSPVWYQLDDKRWLSALFLRVAGEPGTTHPPRGMSQCRKVR
jgi:hypothetical protein